MDIYSSTHFIFVHCTDVPSCKNLIILSCTKLFLTFFADCNFLGNQFDVDCPIPITYKCQIDPNYCANSTEVYTTSTTTSSETSFQETSFEVSPSTFGLQSPDQNSMMLVTMIIAPIVVVLLLILVIATIIFWKMRSRNKSKRDSLRQNGIEMNTLIPPSNDSTSSYGTVPALNQQRDEQNSKQPTLYRAVPTLSNSKSEKVRDKNWLINYEDIIDLSLLGEGAYGAVYYGIYRHQEVAVKMLRNQNFSDKQLEEFQFEANLLRSLPNHTNVVTFYGICETPFCIVTGRNIKMYGLLKMGKWEQFIHQKQKYLFTFSSEYLPNGSVLQYMETQPLTMDYVVQFARDTAAGMVHLVTHLFIENKISGFF